MALRILVHAFRMVFGNLGPAIRISLPVIVVGLVGALIAPSELDTLDVNPARFFSGPFLIWLLAYAVTIPWVAVGWHRYCLKEEYPGALMPAFHGKPVLAYVGWSVLLVVLSMVISVPVMMVLGGLMNAMQASSLGLFWFVWVAVLLWIVQRLSMVLPAAALDESASFKASWEATRPLSGTIFVVMLLFTMLSFAAGWVTVRIFMMSPVLGTIADTAVQWLSMMLGLSLLTTFYGICVEGRTVE